MFTAYAPPVDGQEFDQEVECADLDEALTHLRELITHELEDKDAPPFDRYGIHVEGATHFKEASWIKS